MSKLIVALDPGKYLTKAIGKNLDSKDIEPENVSFRTKMYDLEDGELDVAGNSFLVNYGEKEVIIGEQGTEDGTDETNKASMLHKLASYVAITRYIKPDTENEVYMVLACPLNLLKSAEYKEEYKNYIMNDGKEVSITVDGLNYKFTVKEITLKAEGSGVIFLNKDKFKEKQYGIIDIGGLNMQFCLYVNGVAQADSRFTEMNGSNKLIEGLREDLEIMRKGKPLTYEQVENALKDKVLKLKNKEVEESRPIIKERIRKYIAGDVVKEITKRRIDLDSIHPLLVGGTSEYIKQEIKDIIEHIEVQDNPQWAPVEGLFKIAYAKYFK